MEVDFRNVFLIFGSRLPVMIFDFWKSTFGDNFRKLTSGDGFLFSEVDFR